MMTCVRIRLRSFQKEEKAENKRPQSWGGYVHTSYFLIIRENKQENKEGARVRSEKVLQKRSACCDVSYGGRGRRKRLWPREFAGPLRDASHRRSSGKKEINFSFFFFYLNNINRLIIISEKPFSHRTFDLFP